MTPAKEVRRLYTVDSIPDIGSANQPSLFNTTPAAQVTSVPLASSTTSASDPAGSAQNILASSEGVGSSPTATVNHIPTISINQTSGGVPQVHTPLTNTPQDNTHPSVLIVRPDVVPSPTIEATEDGMLSDTSTLPEPEIFDLGMDDSTPPATDPRMIVDNSTGEITVDSNERPPPSDAATILVDNPPELLLADEDVRPQWLMTATSFLRYVLYFGNLGRAVDLWFAQEARLGYPQLVCAFSCFKTPR